MKKPKKFPRKFDTITFLDQSEDSPNRDARIEWLDYFKEYKICNYNMPYMGSLNYHINRKELKALLNEGKIKLS